MDTNSNALPAGYEKGEFSGEYLGTATYSLEDNKLRFYPFHRLDKEDYERIRAAGFIWAPKQELGNQKSGGTGVSPVHDNGAQCAPYTADSLVPSFMRKTENGKLPL